MKGKTRGILGGETGRKKAEAPKRSGCAGQYSSGRRMVVADRSASVMIQNFVPSRSR